MTKLSEKIAPIFYPAHKAIRDETHDEFWLKGGRGSTKSSFVAIQIILGIIQDPNANAVCFRKVQNSIKDSVQATILWAIDELGETDNFHSISSPHEITYKPTGQKILLRGLDEPRKIKSIKPRFGYFKYLWFEEADEYDGDGEIRSVEQSVLRGGEKFIEFLTYNPPKNPKHWINKAAQEDAVEKFIMHSTYLDIPGHWLGNKWLAKAERLKANNYEAYSHEYLGKPIGNAKEIVFSGRFEEREFETPPINELYQQRFFFGADWGFACLRGDTLVKTDKGEKHIKDIKAGERVLTREGYKTVTLFMNKGIKDVYELDFGLQSPMIVTGDHRIYTADGWKRVDQLKETETVCVIKSNLMGKFIKNILKVKFLITGVKSLVIRLKKCSFYTEIFGNQSMEKSQKEKSYIILIVIKTITILKTLLVCPLQSIQRHIIQKPLDLYQKRSRQRYAKNMDTQKITGNKDELNQCKPLESALIVVLNAIKRLQLPTCIRNIVIPIVEKSLILERVKKSVVVRFVQLNLWLHHIAQEKPALQSVQINLRKLEEKSEVFDISVENGEFFANDVLVHNCDPSVLIRMFIKDDCLWIDYEAYETEVKISDIGSKVFDQIPESRKWSIKADNSRPELIRDVRSQTNKEGKSFNINGAPKWKGSVEDGIDYMLTFKKIIIHKRCPRILRELEIFSYKVDKNTKEILPEIDDKKSRIYEGDDKMGTKDDGMDCCRYGLSDYIKSKASTIGFNI